MEKYTVESRAIIMEYLLHYCYKGSAKALLKEMHTLDSCALSIQNQYNSNSSIISNSSSSNSSNSNSSSSINMKTDTLNEKTINWESVEARKG
ncbi:hypothetical protein RMATCC62417_11347 [Rhizopus microsporus]|nr:hypothetical protein RMATCC62417_11347 [Rhizopus microsporus]